MSENNPPASWQIERENLRIRLDASAKAPVYADRTHIDVPSQQLRRLLDDADAHTARLAALDAEIEQVRWQVNEARDAGSHFEARDFEYLLAGLRRAREIIAGKDKP